LRAGRGFDPADEVALVADAKRELLLRVHRHRLRKEDLQDAYSQATIELIVQARRGTRFASRLHLAHTLEQRFVSRIHDRRRALSGRSPMQALLETAMPLDDIEREQLDVVDARAELETLVLLREDLRRVSALARTLSSDQRLVLASQLALQMPMSEFCSLHGWSPEKYRKVAQRARARLRRLMALEEPSVPSPTRMSEGETGPPMNISPPIHRRALRDAGGRLNGRQHGAPLPRESGRSSETIPPRAPAARVPDAGRTR
jgi:DNA-directed RNA polymerase specialized sigma24 family protein